MAQAAARIPDPSFVAQLLAPLPDTAEPVLTPAFRREIRGLIGHTWRARYRHFLAAEHEFNRATMAKVIARTEDAIPDAVEAAIAVVEARRKLVETVDRLMHLSIPNREALKWKRRWRTLDGNRPEWDAAITRDEAELRGDG